MAKERTSLTVAQLAAIGVKHPSRLSLAEIRTVCASALTQFEPTPAKDTGNEP